MVVPPPHLPRPPRRLRCRSTSTPASSPLVSCQSPTSPAASLSHLTSAPTRSSSLHPPRARLISPPHGALSFRMFFACSVQPHCLTMLRSISSGVSISPAAIRKSGPVPLRRTVLASTSLNATVPSPTPDSYPSPSIPSGPVGHSFLIAEPPLPDSPTLARGPSLRTLASKSTSSASLSIKSEIKRVNRSAALACLEGRGPPPARILRKSHPNFMSMSDDEDEDESLALSPTREANKGFSAIIPSNTPSSEAEPFSSDQQSKMAPVRSRHRSRTMESWFPPLANFIDLRSEEDPPNWRSFIELSTAAA